jgi:hypothetical protein
MVADTEVDMVGAMVGGMVAGMVAVAILASL